MVLPIPHVRVVVELELGADQVFLRWYLGHVEPEPLPTFVSHPGDVMIYFKLQVCDQHGHGHSELAAHHNNNHATEITYLTYPYLIPEF